MIIPRCCYFYRDSYRNVIKHIWYTHIPIYSWCIQLKTKHEINKDNLISIHEVFGSSNPADEFFKKLEEKEKENASKEQKTT